MKKNKRFSGILVKCNDKVLLCKRSNDNTLPGVWSIPGGGIEDGESPEDAARREFYEETNIKVDGNLDLVGFIDRYNKDGTYLKGFMYVYSLEVDEEIYPDLENAKDGGEHTECGYFGINNLPLDKKNDEFYNIIVKNLK
jgi:ADP-ribose pyrophosphatase YjhB (NUDIX family)